MEKRIICFVLITLFILSSLVSCSSSPETTVPASSAPSTPPVEVRTSPLLDSCGWYNVRQNAGSTGHSSAISNFLKKSETLWSVSAGDMKLNGLYVYDVNKDGKLETVYANEKHLFVLDENGNEVWKTELKSVGNTRVLGFFDLGKASGEESLVVLEGSMIVVLDGATGKQLNTPISYSGSFPHFADITDEYPGLEVVVYQKPYMVAYSFSSANSYIKVWQYTHYEYDYYPPAFGIGDFEGDGDLDVYYTTKGHIGALDGKTGKKLGSYDWIPGGSTIGNGRLYGNFLVRDVNGDGKDDMLMVCDWYSEHSFVATSNGKKFTLSFNIFHEFDAYAGSFKSVRPTIDSFPELYGDGKTYLVYSVYNDNDDNKWVTYIFDSTETSKADALSSAQILENTYYHGAVDLDGDGVLELLLSEELSSSAKKYSRLLIYGADEDGAYSLSDSIDFSAFVTEDFGIYENEKYGTTSHYDCIRPLISKINGKTVFFVQSTDGYKAYSFASGRVTLEKTYEYEPVCSADFDNDGIENLFVFTKDKCLALKADGSTAFELKTCSYSSKTPVAADLDGDGSLEIVVAGADSISLIKANARGAALLWSIEGYGSRNDVEIYSAAITKFDGSLKIIAGGIDQTTGESRIRVLNSDGSEYWGYTFEGYANTPLNKKTGIYQYTYGDINGDGQDDVIVFLMRGGDYSEGIFIIDGKSRDLMYKNEGLVAITSGLQTRAVGPCPNYATVADTDYDGKAELFITARDIFTRYEWVDGEIKMTAKQNSGTKYYYEELIPVEYDGKYYLVQSGAWYKYGVLETDGTVVWQKDIDISTTHHVNRSYGIGDINGDGKPEVIIQQRVAGKIVAYDLLTGEEVDSMTVDNNTYSLITADIDGDGSDEIIFTTRWTNTLFVYNFGTRRELSNIKQVPKVVELAFNTSIGDPILADANGDDLLDIILMCGDGMLYCITAAE